MQKIGEYQNEIFNRDILIDDDGNLVSVIKHDQQAIQACIDEAKAIEATHSIFNKSSLMRLVGLIPADVVVHEQVKRGVSGGMYSKDGLNVMVDILKDPNYRYTRTVPPEYNIRKCEDD